MHNWLIHFSINTNVRGVGGGGNEGGTSMPFTLSVQLWSQLMLIMKDASESSFLVHSWSGKGVSTRIRLG